MVYFDRPMHPAFVDAALADPNLRVARLNSGDSPTVLDEKLAGCHGYYISSSRSALAPRYQVSSELLSRMPNLQVVVMYGVGYDSVDVSACSDAGVVVVNQAGGNSEAVAEHALCLILAALKRVPENQTRLQLGTALSSEDLMGRELAHRRIGIVGLGHIGSRLVQMLRPFDCEVQAYDPYLDETTCAHRGAEKVDWNTLLSTSEVISVHCPLTIETRGMFRAREFSQMPSESVFITTARGGIHDERDLYNALVEGHIAGAGLDVWEQEPPMPDTPLLTLPTVLATRHTAGVTVESRERVAIMAANVLSRAAEGKQLPRVVNPEMLTRNARHPADADG